MDLFFRIMMFMNSRIDKSITNALKAKNIQYEGGAKSSVLIKINDTWSVSISQMFLMEANNIVIYPASAAETFLRKNGDVYYDEDSSDSTNYGYSEGCRRFKTGEEIAEEIERLQKLLA